MDRLQLPACPMWLVLTTAGAAASSFDKLRMKFFLGQMPSRTLLHAELVEARVLVMQCSCGAIT
jgi:hypothetical protein